MNHRLNNPEQRRRRSSRRLSHTTISICALLLFALLRTQAARALESLDQFPRSALEIRTHDGRQWFNIWIADTEAREEQGLMFVRALPSDQGMLFPQAKPRVMSMWMRNTLIPLDLLFITADGRIAYIREAAPPESDDLITTETPVKAVLELAAGEVAKRHIRVGDRLLHALFTMPSKLSH